MQPVLHMKQTPWQNCVQGCTHRMRDSYGGGGCACLSWSALSCASFGPMPVPKCIPTISSKPSGRSRLCANASSCCALLEAPGAIAETGWSGATALW